MALTGEGLIDEIEAYIGRSSSNDELMDDTRTTRWLNNGQAEIADLVPGIPSLNFENNTTFDTTGTVVYNITELTYGDTTTDSPPCRITQVWYLDGNESRELKYLPPDEFESLHPDPTNADEAFGKPKEWTQKNNTEVEIYPYCDSAYWDKDLKFVGDFYPRDFTTNDTGVSDISRADELLIAYGVWQAWKAIGNVMEEQRARKAWSNPQPAPGEDVGELEKFKDKVNAMPGWSWNLYD